MKKTTASLQDQFSCRSSFFCRPLFLSLHAFTLALAFLFCARSSFGRLLFPSLHAFTLALAFLSRSPLVTRVPQRLILPDLRTYFVPSHYCPFFSPSSPQPLVYPCRRREGFARDVRFKRTKQAIVLLSGHRELLEHASNAPMWGVLPCSRRRAQFPQLVLLMRS